MRRRTLVAGLGSLVASGSLAVGTGAFSSTSAERRVSVSVAQDDQALLALDDNGAGTGPGGLGRSIEGDDGRVELFLPGVGRRNEREHLGLGVESTYEFDRDSAADDPGLVGIRNRGTQTVSVFSRHETDSQLEIELYDVSDHDRTAFRREPAELDPGESVNVGVRVRIHSVDVTESDERLTFDEQLTIVARATE